MIVLSLIYLGIGYIFEQEIFLTRSKWKIQPEKEKGVIMEAVISYNKIYSDLYASDGVPLRLDDFPASKQLRHELFRNLGFLRDKNLILVYDMADLVFVEVKRPSPMTAEVTTYEEWNYIYQKSPSRQIAQSIKGMGQGFKYLLVKRKEGWFVVDYAPADVEIEKEDKFYY